jgi:hypothetical protein
LDESHVTVEGVRSQLDPDNPGNAARKQRFTPWGGLSEHFCTMSDACLNGSSD